MAVRTWHTGKLVILWIWGGLIAAFLLTDFMGRAVNLAPLTHLLELAATLFILLALSGITWYWLGGKESK